uniref:Uncharacterized protein n=1 Tax=Oryza sativa subsp. japonica TaxID=39947 RepID=Q6YTA2_ORYSJ|nr:hypothetical protein [Oryza sativa Japonica Group]BAC99955.1 hypothetical protein [Oryza sativa Japonica Group]
MQKVRPQALYGRPKLQLAPCRPLYGRQGPNRNFGRRRQTARSTHRLPHQVARWAGPSGLTTLGRVWLGRDPLGFRFKTHPLLF